MRRMSLAIDNYSLQVGNLTYIIIYSVLLLIMYTGVSIIMRQPNFRSRGLSETRNMFLEEAYNIKIDFLYSYTY